MQNKEERGNFTMLGSMLSKIRKEKHMTKVELAKQTGINIGHLTHIEKSERNPSHKALKSITHALAVPYQMISHLYDLPVTEEDIRCKMIDHLSYHKVLAVDSYSQFIECPSNVPYSSIALKILDDAMEPYFKKGTYGFLQLNVPLKNKEIGLFEYKGQLLVRRFIIRKDKLVLRADNKTYEDIDLTEDTSFTIIGKLLNGNP